MSALWCICYRCTAAMPVVKDPVKPADRAEVYRRDGGCIAPLLDRDAGPCRDQHGREVPRTDKRSRTLDHVPPQPGSTRISTPRWMATACWGHGVHNGPGGTNWVTGHRDLERLYLALVTVLMEVELVYEQPPFVYFPELLELAQREHLEMTVTV